jgi:hypothetical protein
MVEEANNVIPIVYYGYWIIMLAVMVLIFGYWALRTKNSISGADSKLLAGVLVLFVGLLYAIDQLPVLHTHFDGVVGGFVAGYHEPLMHGFIKFWYKVGIAVLLLSYAFSNVQKY